MSRLLYKLALAVGYLLLAGSLVGFLGSSSCYYSSGHCDDDDFDDDDWCDDDDDDVLVVVLRGELDARSAGPSPPPALGDSPRWSSLEIPGSPEDPALDWPGPLSNELAAYALTTFELVPSLAPGTHPVRRIVGIQGLSLFDLGGEREFGARDLETVTQRILLANESLLGLPHSAGRRVFAGVRFTDASIEVGWAQEFPGGGLAGRASADSPELRSGALSGSLEGPGTVFCFDRLGNLFAIENTARVPVE